MDAPRYVLLEGDCREQLKELPDSSIDSVVTDPPYDLTNGGSKGFMGKAWDGTGIAFDPTLWVEVMRALKPGGHLLAFGGTRTYHRMACAIEDAGFEIRDSIHWVYGSGMPKSLNVSIAADKLLGLQGDRGKRFNNAGSLDLPPPPRDYEAYEPKSDFAKQWLGWGTALKPSHEPIVLARKPLSDTVVLNVDAYGTGALNIDATRVGDEVRVNPPAGNKPGTPSLNMSVYGMPDDAPATLAVGRWPSNIVFSHSPDCDESREEDGDGTCAPGCPVIELDLQNNGASRFFPCFRYQAKPSRKERDEGCEALPTKVIRTGLQGAMPVTQTGEQKDRFEREALNTHPTVKPVELMAWLIRLITPPDGVVLDPFTGSGSTGVAALKNGFRFVGIEREEEYQRIAAARLEGASRG
jgi:DNA modification methylase